MAFVTMAIVTMAIVTFAFFLIPSPLWKSPPFPRGFEQSPLSNFDETRYIDSVWDAI